MYSLNHNKLGLVAFLITFFAILGIGVFVFAATVTLTPSKLFWGRTYDNTVWANAQNDTSPNETATNWNGNNSPRTDFGSNCNGSSDYCLYRNFSTFNTGSTTLASATINSVTFRFKSQAKIDNGGSVNIAESNWSGNSELGDFVKIMASPTNATQIGTAITIASVNTDSSTWNDIVLNATGLAYMNYGTNGTTSIAFLSSADYTNIAPTTNNQVSDLNVAQEVLVIDYTTSGGVTPLPPANFIDFSLNWLQQFIKWLS